MDEFYRVRLSSGEAMAALSGLKALRALTDPAAGGADTDMETGILDATIARLEEELPEYLAGRTDRLAGSLAAALVEHIGQGRVTAEAEAAGIEPPFPIGRTRRLLEDAFERRVPVEIEYFVRSRNEWTTRRVDISDVFEENDSWLMSGHCGLRHDFRQFKLDHIRSVRVLDDKAENEGMRDPFEEE